MRRLSEQSWTRWWGRWWWRPRCRRRRRRRWMRVYSIVPSGSPPDRPSQQSDSLELILGVPQPQLDLTFTDNKGYNIAWAAVLNPQQTKQRVRSQQAFKSLLLPTWPWSLECHYRIQQVHLNGLKKSSVFWHPLYI